jgi:hypothetical protein
MASKYWATVQTGVLLTYVVSAGIYLFGPSDLSERTVNIVKVILGLHFLEFIVVGMKLTQGDNKGVLTHFANTMVYGFIYWVPLFQDRSAKSS